MKTEKEKSLNRQKGSAAIEAILSFVGFLFVIFTILNIVNFCRVQTLISNAVDTAAKEMSQYSYFYEISGLSKFNKETQKLADGGSAVLNEVVGNVDNLYKSVNGAVKNTIDRTTEITNAIEGGTADVDTIKGQLNGINSDVQGVETAMNLMSASVEGIMSNPILYLKSIVAVAGNEGLELLKSHAIAAPLAKALTAKHFGSSMAEADRYLEELGVVDGLDGMNFKMSTIFATGTPDEIHIVVYYRLKINQILDWAELEAILSKDAVARAWLGGDNVTQKVTPAVSGTSPTTTPEGGQNNQPAEGEPEKEKNEETKPEETDKGSGTGSTDLWALPKTSDDGYYAVQSPAFTKLMGDTYGFSSNGNIPYLCGQNGSIAYGCSNYVDADGLIRGINGQNSVLAESAYLSSIRALKNAEDSYDPEAPISAHNYKPGSVKQIQYVVYVPENIPDDKLNEIKAAGEIGVERYKNEAKEIIGRDIDVHISYVKGGGTYDYGGSEQ